VGERQQDVLRLQPDMIPSLRDAFSAAVDQVEAALVQLGRGGYLPTPWMGDEVSTEVAAHYLQRAMNAPDSSFQALVSYRDELARVHDTLQQMEHYYGRKEAENAADLRRMT
jgi:hypothetical protein